MCICIYIYIYIYMMLYIYVYVYIYIYIWQCPEKSLWKTYRLRLTLRRRKNSFAPWVQAHIMGPCQGHGQMPATWGPGPGPWPKKERGSRAPCALFWVRARVPGPICPSNLFSYGQNKSCSLCCWGTATSVGPTYFSKGKIKVVKLIKGLKLHFIFEK